MGSIQNEQIESVTAAYASRAAGYAASAAAAAKTVRTLGVARLLCFIVIIIEGAALLGDRRSAGAKWILVALTVGVFVLLVAWHRRVRQREAMQLSLAQCCRWGIDRVHRRWQSLPDARPIANPVDHAFAGDLHLTGAQSVVRLLQATSTAGTVVLAEWLLAEQPPGVELLQARQRVVQLFGTQHEWRERLSVLGGRLTGSTSALDAFCDWAEGEPWLRPRRVLRLLVRLLTAMTLLAIVAAATHLISPVLVLLLIVLNYLITGVARRELAATLGAASSSGTRLRGYGALFRQAQRALTGSAELREWGERLGGADSGRAFARLDQLAACGEVRFSAMGHDALQGLVLWDYHVVDALESWQRSYGPAVRKWIRALGELEAQAALATLAHENPGWSFPTFVSDPAGTLDGSSLAHPLLAADVRVGNDVVVGPRGTILLVTGSNMAGKTTLLRAIALNIVLAQAGAPVCASALTLSRFRLRTSMQATDSLERGLSLFMAGLVRLKAIVDAAVSQSECALLYLADEILRGTNATDRHNAIIAVLGTLTAAGAVGVVATHDPDLAYAPGIEAKIRAVNLIEQFRDSPDGPSMWFDYRLRPGVATTRNAMKLLEMIGLGSDTASSREASG